MELPKSKWPLASRKFITCINSTFINHRSPIRMMTKSEKNANSTERFELSIAITYKNMKLFRFVPSDERTAGDPNHNSTAYHTAWTELIYIAHLTAKFLSPWRSCQMQSPVFATYAGVLEIHHFLTKTTKKTGQGKCVCSSHGAAANPRLKSVRIHVYIDNYTSAAFEQAYSYHAVLNSCCFLIPIFVIHFSP